MIQSMSRKGNCWDNAPMESFFGTLKTELVHHREYLDRDTARRDLFAYIEGYYNRRRIHSAMATSPHSRQRRNTRNPVSTFPGECQCRFVRLSGNRRGPERRSDAQFPAVGRP